MPTYRTLPQMLLDSCERWSSKPALWHKLRGKYSAVSYGQLARRVHEAAAGLVTCGVKPGDRVAIMSENCPEWAYCDWAILSLGAQTVPIYPTLMPEQVGHILQDSGAVVAVAGDARCAEKIRTACKERNLNVVEIVLHGDAAGALPLHRIVDEGKDTPLTFETWKEGCALVDANDVATIIYTSGTTGEPKGAVLDHKAFTFLCEAILNNLPISQNDRFFSFLPLSHVYERMAGHFLPISCGAEIAYCESLRSMAADIVQAQPTVILAVPRFLESVKTRIESAAIEGSWLKRTLMNMQLSRGAERLKHRLRPVGAFGGTLDKLVGAKVRERFGGKLRFFVSGGAALPPDIAEFYGAFGILILQGYGLTETAPVISVNHPDRSVYQSVGEVIPGVEVQIASDGEILMRGPSRMQGYYNRPDETALVIDKDGWFHTGDLGRLDGNRLWITGRKKEIIVMANGKNVSPTELESRLKRSPWIDEVMVLGDDQDLISALIVPNFELVRSVCQSNHLSVSHQSEMVEYPVIVEKLKEEINKANAQLPDYEKIKRWTLLSESWTIESGEITPTLKLKRAFIKEKYAAVIQNLK